MELLRTLECPNSFLSMILYARFKIPWTTDVTPIASPKIYVQLPKKKAILMAKEKGYKSLGINPLCAEWYTMYVRGSYVAKGDLAFPGHLHIIARALWLFHICH